MSAKGPDNRIVQLVQEGISQDGLTLGFMINLHQVEVSIVQDIAKTLPVTHAATVLLSLNEIKDAGAQALAEVLPCTHINTLKISLNDTVYESVQALAEMLPDTQITTLNVTFNHIGASCQALAGVLPETQVSYVHSRWRTVVSAFTHAVGDLEEILPRTRVNAFKVYVNDVGEKIALALAEALKFNQLKIGMIPRVLESLYYLTDEVKQSRIPHPSLISKMSYPVPESSSDIELKFAVGIYTYLPKDSRNNVLAFLPMMSYCRASKITAYMEKRYKDTALETEATGAAGKQEEDGELEATGASAAAPGMQEDDDGQAAQAQKPHIRNGKRRATEMIGDVKLAHAPLRMGQFSDDYLHCLTFDAAKSSAANQQDSEDDLYDEQSQKDKRKSARHA